MSSFPIPQTMRALVVQESKTVKVEEVPVPALEENEVLVKVHSIAQNPTDWKYVDFTSPPGNIIGCDFSGTVVKLGSNAITHVKVGDTVAAFVHGGNHKDRGAFAQYAKADSDLVWKFSTDSISFEGAATMNCAFWTCIQAFYHRMGLHEPSAITEHGEWILIYGGSTSLGLFAIQLAKLSGYKVATTVSPRNFEIVKSLGADAVFDYKAPDVVEQIQKTTGNSLRLAFDTISDAATQAISVKSLSSAPEGTTPKKLVVVQPPNKEAQALRNDVVIQHTLLYTALGRAFDYGPTAHYQASPADRKHMASWIPKVESLVNSGKVKPNPVKLWPGGLEAVPEGFQYMREGKVSAEKIVYNV
ncbi:GroES-like protein [Ceratobasidium sp. AG-I]|nr:GroES-like protein [Ceratobasidium sp. AG-I]